MDLPQLAQNIVAVERLLHQLSGACAEVLGTLLPVRAATMAQRNPLLWEMRLLSAPRGLAQPAMRCLASVIAVDCYRRRGCTHPDLAPDQAPGHGAHATVKDDSAVLPWRLFRGLFLMYLTADSTLPFFCANSR